MSEPERVCLGYIGVDSGCIVVGDPSYMTNGAPDIEERLAAMEGPAQGGEVPHAFTATVVMQSGLGDGRYPVYAYYHDVPGWGRRIAYAVVDFREDPE